MNKPGKNCNWTFLLINEVVNKSPFAALKTCQCFSHNRGGRTSGLRMEDDAPWEKYPINYSDDIKRAMDYYEMSINTRYRATKTTDQDKASQNTANTSSTQNDSAFQDSQDPWPTVPIRTPSEIDSDSSSDPNMDTDHEPIRDKWSPP